MTLIKSISGIRGTVGGKTGDNLTPIDAAKYASAYGTMLQRKGVGQAVVIGRDARMSGGALARLVAACLQSTGNNVIDLGLSTTPTVEMAVAGLGAGGGIILTASHNPKEWNALKLLNEKGEFISAADGEEVLRIAQEADFEFVPVNRLGSYQTDDTWLQRHVDAITGYGLTDVAAIGSRNFKVVVDGVNSSGGVAVPLLLRALGVADIVELFCEPNGDFQHNPEPLPDSLSALAQEVRRQNADLGIAVDPDVDRLAIVCEDGSMFGEEYTLVAVADYVLQHRKGDTVSNLSSTKALRDVTAKAGCSHHASAVGEVNVVEKMKEVNAVVGGEGNGGVIVPDLHYGRDALAGIALFLSHLARFGKSCSKLRATYPDYVISKNKIELTPDIDVDAVLAHLQHKYRNYPISTIDGVRIELDDDWVHLRKSNTEPIIRIYAESNSQNTAQAIARRIMEDVKVHLMGG